MFGRRPRGHTRSGAALAAIVLAGAAVCGWAVTPARADSTETTILEADSQVLSAPAKTLMQARELGVTTLRLAMPWQDIAPDPTSRHRPRFEATDPGAYRAVNWAPFDAVIREATRLGIAVDLDLDYGAPVWATGTGQPHQGYPHTQWEPNAAQYGYFAQAAGERYSGDWDPVTRRPDPGNPVDLPRVSFWSVWNEPDYGPSLAPQELPGHPGVEDSPRMYRLLVDAAWRGLAASGQRTPQDTIIIGELAPRSELTTPDGFGDFNGMTPMLFLENMYCLNSAFVPWRGEAAVLRGCPSTAAGSARFVADNPGLFENSGISDHPYDEWFAPDHELDIPRLPGWALENTQDTSLATIGVLERGLDRLTGAYHDPEQLPIWDTEYGYQTSPPHMAPWPTPSRAAYFDNWAEYLHYKNPRIRSFCQYLINDVAPDTKADEFGGFPSGLVAYDGRPKADYAAFRMPLYLPRTVAANATQSLQVWGAARPASFAIRDLGASPLTSMVTLQFRPRGARTFSTLAVVAVNPQGYYDVDERFGTSGTLRASWRVPRDGLLELSGRTLYSRSVSVSVG